MGRSIDIGETESSIFCKKDLTRRKAVTMLRSQMKAKELLASTDKATGLRARKLLTKRGIKHGFIAKRMKLSDAMLSQLLSGGRAWNARKAELFLEALR